MLNNDELYMLKFNKIMFCSVLLNKVLICRRVNRLAPFLCSAFSIDVILLSFEIYKYAGLCVSQII